IRSLPVALHVALPGRSYFQLSGGKHRQGGTSTLRYALAPKRTSADFPVRSNPRASHGSSKRLKPSCRSTLLRTGKSALRPYGSVKKMRPSHPAIDAACHLPFLNCAGSTLKMVATAPVLI